MANARKTYRITRGRPFNEDWRDLILEFYDHERGRLIRVVAKAQNYDARDRTPELREGMMWYYRNEKGETVTIRRSSYPREPLEQD